MHDQIKFQLYTHFARVGQALSSPKRLELLDLLSQSEMTVETLTAKSGLSFSNASAHLRVLKNACLVESRKVGLYVKYRLADPEVFTLLRLLQGLARKRLAEVEQLVRLYFEKPGELETVDAASLLDRMRGGEVTLLDVRPGDEFESGHLPGALSVPADELERRIAALPRNLPIVAYCRGPYCLFSVEAIQALRSEGFEARRLELGFPDWKARGYPLAPSAGGPEPALDRQRS